MPYVVDLGLTAAARVYKQYEVGMTYSFLGIYAFSNFAFVGSQFSLLARYRFIQVEYARADNGAVKGCFTKYQGTPGIQQFSASFFLYKSTMLGLKVTTSPTNGNEDERLAEYRLLLSFTF